MRLGLELDVLKYTHDIRGVETDAAWRALAFFSVAVCILYFTCKLPKLSQFQKSSGKFSGL